MASSSTTSTSASSLVATLVPLLLLQVIPFLLLFILFRTRVMRIYQPRTYLGSLKEYEKTPKPSQTMFGWIKDFRAIPDTWVLSHQSLDGYLFLRFFKVVTILCVGGCVILWPVLFPVNATGGGGQQQLDLLALTNIAKPNYYYAQAIMAAIFMTWVLFLVGREYLFFIHLRQAYLLSPQISSRMSSRTVIFTDVPEEYLTEERLRATFPFVKHVWMQTKCQKLADLVKERDKVAMKLEGAEVSLCKAANGQRLKAAKKGGNADAEDPIKWAEEKKRPKHKLKPLIGQKVDTIDWCRGQLRTLIPQVEAMQAEHFNGKADKAGAVIIEFENIQAAESAFQQINFHAPKIFRPRAIGVRPDEVIFDNMDIPWWRRDIGYVVATSGVTALTIMWVPLTAFVGILTNLHKLESYSFLAWLKKVPPAIFGVISGLLPVILMAVLLALVPIIMFLIAKRLGAVSHGETNLRVQTWYFWFQIVNLWLVTTVASSAVSVIKSISSNPSTAVTILRNNLPSSSNFYINYFVGQGLIIFAGTILNVVAVVVLILLDKLLDKTPRKKFNRYVKIASLTWGGIYPKFSMLGVIAIAYSLIAPLILGFAGLAFFLFYVAFRYNLIYSLDTKGLSSQGRNYPIALKQLLVGMYIAYIMMIGMAGINAGSGAAGAGPLIILIAALILTILLHLGMSHALNPLASALPRDLLVESTRKGATASQAGGVFHGGLGQSEHTMEGGKANGQSTAAPILSTRPHLTGFQRIVHWLLHPASLPEFAPHMSEPEPEYTADVRREAYLNPAITSAAPLLWIVHDEMGLSAREREETGKVIGVTDQGAWWDEKSGKLTTVWMGEEKRGESNRAAEAPIYEEKASY